jgi:hypothetical protein
MWGQALRFPRIFTRALHACIWLACAFILRPYRAKPRIGHDDRHAALGQQGRDVRHHGDRAAGAIFVVCVLTFRRGIVGELGRFLKRAL